MMVLKNMEIFPFSLHGRRNGSRASYPSGLQPPSPQRWRNIMDERPYGRFLSNHGAVVLIAAALTATIPGEISAQQAPKNDHNNHCQAPDTNGQTTDRRAAPNPKTDTSKLSECGGVLKPPATGDSELEKPAPPVGNTRVIPPGSIPEEHGNDTPKNQ
jgi:hypothetical protein